MDVLMIVALVLQLLIVFLIVGAWVAIGMLPGRIAKQRGHPQADAINVLGWFGAITMGILAPIAFAWAYSKPVFTPIEMGPQAAPGQTDPEPAGPAEQEAES